MYFLLSIFACQVIAAEHIKQSDALELNYGCLNNDLFLLDYGFVVPSNPYDCIELKYDAALLDAASMAAGVTSPNFSSPSPWQLEILSQLNLDGENPDLKVYLFPHPTFSFPLKFTAICKWYTMKPISQCLVSLNEYYSKV